MGYLMEMRTTAILSCSFWGLLSIVSMVLAGTARCSNDGFDGALGDAASDVPIVDGSAPADRDPPADAAGADAEPVEPNQGWIGSACQGEGDCEYTGAECKDDGYPQGMCSLPCDALCPDPAETGHASTFCIKDPSSQGAGICVARCDYLLFPETGCRNGYLCLVKERFTQPTVRQAVCFLDETPATCDGDEVVQPNNGIQEPSGLAGCPPGMTPIQGTGLCIDRWEAFLVEVLPGGQEVPFSPYFNPGTLLVRAKSAPLAVPQGYMSGDQAAQACAEAGKRLCTRDEWELACRGPENNIYPYGNTRQDGACNDSRTVHPAVEYFGTTEAWIWSELDHSCLNQLADGLDPAGANESCVTPGSVFDMMGNLHEWVSDPAGTFKGGFYVDTVLNGEGCLYTTTAHSFTYWDYSTGFRCCYDL